MFGVSGTPQPAQVEERWPPNIADDDDGGADNFGSGGRTVPYFSGGGGRKQACAVCKV